MPRMNHRLLVEKSASDLKTVIEQLLFYVAEVGGLDKVDKIHRTLLQNVFSFYKRIGDINQQEINIVWESASELSKALLKKKANDVVEKARADNRIDKNRLLYGKYWIFPGNPPRYIRCSDHIDYALHNGKDFIEGLGVDAYDYLHAVNSGKMNVMPLILSAGGILADFVMEGKRKVGRFQLSQASLPWLKSLLSKMPIYKSHIRIVDHTEGYVGPQTGIYFAFRRTIKDKV